MFHDGGREALTQSVIIAGMALNRETAQLAAAANPHAEVVQESNFTSTGPGTNLAALQTFAIDWTCLLSPPHPHRQTFLSSRNPHGDPPGPHPNGSLRISPYARVRGPQS